MQELQWRREHLLPEVQLLIIDAVLDISQDWTTKLDILRACALTCQAWLPTARQNLYRNVRLDSQDQCNLLSRTLKTSPAIPPLIERIYYTNTSRYNAGGDVEAQRDVPMTADVISMLSSLRSVVFAFRHVTPQHLFPFARSFSVLANLDSLCLRNAIAMSYLDMAHLLWSFNAIRSIELDGCGWFRNLTPIVDANAHPGRCGNLRDLKIRNHPMCPKVGPYLDMFAPADTVKSLRLWCDLEQDSDDGFHAYPSLETLDLGTIESEGAWIVAALSHVRSNNLRQLSLTFRPHEKPLEAVFRGWRESRLDDILSAAPFLGLERLNISLFSSFAAPEHAQVEMAHILPQCHARGIVNLDVRPREDPSIGTL